MLFHWQKKFQGNLFKGFVPRFGLNYRNLPFTTNNQTMNEQLTAYRELRNDRTIPYQLFEELVYLFPTLLVMDADGRIDHFEEGHIQHEAEHAAREKGLDVNQLETELAFLKASLTEVKPIMLKALYELNQQHDIANDVLDQMLSSAGVSSESQTNNFIFSNYHSFFDLFRSFISYFLQPDPTKPFIRESEKEAMLAVLVAIDGLNERNYQLLEDLVED